MELPLCIQQNEKETVLVYSDEYGFCHGTPIDYLQSLCLQHGSSMQGRIDSFKYLTNTHQKPAILISEITSHIYFPTESMHKKSCIWLLYNEIVHIQSLNYANSLVTFTNGVTIEASVNKRVLQKQMKRCEQYLQKLTDTQLPKASISKGDFHV